MTDWRLVPVEPTEEMIAAAYLSERDWAIETCRNIIAAAPAPPEALVEEVARVICAHILPDEGGPWVPAEPIIVAARAIITKLSGEKT